MKSLPKPLVICSFVLILLIGSVTEARIGGGRSSGSRGFRGFTPRSAPTYQNPSRTQQQPNYSTQQQTPPLMAPASGGAFTRGLMGGLAGGLIGSMLFGGLGHAGGMGGFGGGIGIFEIFLLLGLGYMAFRMIANRKPAFIGGSPRREMTEPGPFAGSSEESEASHLQRYDSSFDLESFKEARMDDFMRLQAAWGQRDLSTLSNLIAPEIRLELDADIAQLKAQGHINRIENIAVRGIELIEAWQERGREFATVRIRANLTDYTVTESSNELIAGSKTNPVKFEECWTFVRAIGSSINSSKDSWTLSAIEA